MLNKTGLRFCVSLATLAITASTASHAHAQVCGSCGNVNITSTGVSVEDNTGSTPAVLGLTNNGVGVNGGSSTQDGVWGTSTSSNGVEGDSSGIGSSGVYGFNSSGSGYGVAGRASGTGYAVYGDNTSTSGWSGVFTGKVYVATGLDVAGTCVYGSCSSDERLKKNIKPLTGSLDAVSALRPVTFEWKNPRGLDRTPGIQTGFIAQEVEKIEPTWVSTDAEGFKTINRDALPMLLVDSIKTLRAQNDELRGRVASLEAARHPLSQNFGMMGGLGMLVVGGAFMAGRRRNA